MRDKTENIIRGEVLAPENRGVRMPDGTPLGLGFLGAAKFNAVGRVLDAYERALRSAISARNAEADHMDAKVRLAIAHERLNQVPLFRQAEARRIEREVEIAEMRGELERLQLQQQISEAKQLRTKQQTEERQAKADSDADQFTAFMNDLKRLPEMLKACARAKEDIIRDAGGEDKLSDAQRNMCDFIDAWLESLYNQRQAGPGVDA